MSNKLVVKGWGILFDLDQINCHCRYLSNNYSPKWVSNRLICVEQLKLDCEFWEFKNFDFWLSWKAMTAITNEAFTLLSIHISSTEFWGRINHHLENFYNELQFISIFWNYSIVIIRKWKWRKIKIWLLLTTLKLLTFTKTFHKNFLNLPYLEPLVIKLT